MIKNLIGGIAVGIANVIPGVSGGTMMVILGIFNRTMEAISGIFSKVEPDFLHQYFKFILVVRKIAICGYACFYRYNTAYKKQNYKVDFIFHIVFQVTIFML